MKTDKIVSLKDKARHDVDGGGDLIESFIDYEDVKEAVLELINLKRKNIFSQERIDFNKIENSSYAQDMEFHNENILNEIDTIKEIFGDFENEN